MTSIARLSLNEMPFKPGKKIVEELQASGQTVNRYPEWDAITLRTALADHYSLTPDWVVVGNGSIGVIQQAMVASGQGEIIYSWPTFEAFEIAARALGMPIQRVDLANNACDLNQYAASITEQTSMVIICTPNAPTGGIVHQAELESFIQKVPEDVLVLIDEAYGEFVPSDLAVDALGLVKQHQNVMFTRTFSKAYGLAGLRVGYGIAQPTLADRVSKAGLPFPVAAPFQAAALAALKDRRRMVQYVNRISQERHHLATKLRALGVEVVEGYGNFVWLPVGEQAEAVAHEFRGQGVLIKPVIPYGVRITIGTKSDTETVCRAWTQANLGKTLDKTEALSLHSTAFEGA